MTRCEGRLGAKPPLPNLDEDIILKRIPPRPSGKALPSVAQLHQDWRLPEIVAGPGSSEQSVGSAAKQDGNLPTHNV